MEPEKTGPDKPRNPNEPTEPVVWVTAYLAHWATYHHHKEQMAFAAIGLYLTAATTSLLIRLPDEFTANSSCLSWLLLVGLALTAGAGAYYIGWQLTMRAIAAHMVAACASLSMEWQAQHVDSACLFPSEKHKYSEQLLPKPLADKLKANPLTFGKGPLMPVIPIWIVLVIWTVIAITNLVKILFFLATGPENDLIRGVMVFTAVWTTASFFYPMKVLYLDREELPS